MAAENYIKLRDVVVPTVTKEGKYVRKDVADKEGVYIERTGECRLFMFVPEFMGEFLETWRDAGDIKLEHKLMKSARSRDRSNADRRWAIIGRSPDGLSNAYRKVCEAFVESKMTLTTEPVIWIDVPGGYSYRSSDTGLYLKFGRYLRNTTASKSGYRQHFEWEEDLQPRRRCGEPHDGDDLVIPFDPVIWARLNQIKDAISSAKERLETILRSGDQALPQLMSGNALQLTGPTDG